MAKKFIIVGALISLLGACASQPEKDASQRPEWVMGSSSEYPRAKYISGVGDATGMSEAKERARAEVAKVFDVTIFSSSSDATQYKESRAGGFTESSSAWQVSREIQSDTEQRLQGVKIAEMWQDPQTSRFYAIAVLPRQVTALHLREDIQQLDAATSDVIQRAQQSGSLMKKIQASTDAIVLQQKRRALNSQLQVIAISGQGETANYSVEKLQADHQDLLSRITVKAAAEGEKEGELVSALEDALANIGFTVTDAADYTLQATLRTTALQPQGSWYYHKGTLQISLLGEGQRTLGGHSWDFKVSASDPELAKLRVMEQVKKLLANDLNRELFAMLEK